MSALKPVFPCISVVAAESFSVAVSGVKDSSSIEFSHSVIDFFDSDNKCGTVAAFEVFIILIAYSRGVELSGEPLSQVGQIELAGEQEQLLQPRQASGTLGNSEALEDLKEAEEKVQVSKNYYLGILQLLPYFTRSYD